MIEKFAQGLGEVLKGLVQIAIKKIKVIMFTRTNNITNHNFNVEKGGTLNLFVIADKETAEKMANTLKQCPVEVKELTKTQELEHPEQ